jgi:hypothetical protein
MIRLVSVLSRLYRHSLRFYPPAYRAEFGDEIEEVFDQALQEAGEGGSRAVFSRLLRELGDLPGVLLRVHLLRRQPEMAFQVFPQTSDRIPLGTALLSMLPLFLAGPFFLIMSYSSSLFPQAPAWLWSFFVAVAVVGIVGGLILGAVRKFPRWSYPYAVYVLIMLTFLVTFLWNGTPWNVNDEMGILLLVAGIFVLVTCRLPLFNTLYANIWRDWTLLSYALYAGTLLFVSIQDHDVTPRLTLLVLLPSLIWIMGALAHLRLASARLRVAVLLLSSLLAYSVWMVPIIGMEHNTLAYLFRMYRFLFDLGWVLAALVVAPVLIGVFAFNRLEKRTAA